MVGKCWENAEKSTFSMGKIAEKQWDIIFLHDFNVKHGGSHGGKSQHDDYGGIPWELVGECHHVPTKFMRKKPQTIVNCSKIQQNTLLSCKPKPLPNFWNCSEVLQCSKSKITRGFHIQWYFHGVNSRFMISKHVDGSNSRSFFFQLIQPFLGGPHSDQQPWLCLRLHLCRDPKALAISSVHDPTYLI